MDEREKALERAMNETRDAMLKRYRPKVRELFDKGTLPPGTPGLAALFEEDGGQR